MEKDSLQVLKMSKTILLVDWPNPALPRILVESGFDVYCYSPDQYSRAEIMPYAPLNIDAKNIFKPGKEEDGCLVFVRLAGRPPSVDIVYVYRPEEELPRIITEHALPLEAKSIWIDPLSTSAITHKIVAAAGLNFINNAFILETLKKLISS